MFRPAEMCTLRVLALAALFSLAAAAAGGGGGGGGGDGGPGSPCPGTGGGKALVPGDCAACDVLDILNIKPTGW